MEFMRNKITLRTRKWRTSLGVHAIDFYIPFTIHPYTYLIGMIIYYNTCP